MKSVPPVNKNDDILLTIDALTSEGHGVGRADGYAVFVPGALPGETVRAHMVKTAPNFGFAKLIQIETASPDRVTPRCPVCDKCGGCTLQHLAYPAQLAVKRAQVRDALERLGGVQDPPVAQTIGMAEPWRYRNKGSFPFAQDGGSVRFGFFSPRSHRLVPINDCPIQHARIVDTARRVAEWANTYGVPAYDEQNRRGQLRHAVARVTAAGEGMAVVVTAGERLRHEAELLELLAGTDSVWHNVNPDETNVICGPHYRLLAGEGRLTETIGSLRFLVSPQSFLQVNPSQTEVLYDEAVRLLDPKPTETVLDAYCGIGTLSLLAARRAGRVIGVESTPEAVADARENARLNGMDNAEFLCGACEDVLPKLVEHGTRIDAALADPPRKGFDARALEALAGCGAQRIVYVSCNPASLARDVKLLRERGFALVSAQPVDMFPHTAHVETVALLSRL